jgi:transposase
MMEQTTTLMELVYVGADISKDKVDFYYELDGKKSHLIIKNEPDLLNAYVESLKRALKLKNRSVWFIMEATGTYVEKLMSVLWDLEVCFSVISPNKSRAFMKTEGLTTINDKEAARMLHLFGIQKKPRAYEMPSDAQLELKQLIGAVNRLKKALQVVENQMHADDYRQREVLLITQIWQNQQARLKADIKQIEDEIQSLTQENFQKMLQNLTSIKGVGKETATAVVVLTQGFANFQSAKQFVKFIGLCPTQDTSGKSVRKGKAIPKNGNALIKALLFNAARSTLRSDNVFKRFFDSLVARGKNGMLAMTALMRKIATVIFAVATQQKTFELEYN